jgi:hypothetical protein
MKKIFQFITAIAVVAPVAVWATSEPSSQTEHASPLACNAFVLSPEARKRHFEEVGPALLKLKKSSRELPDTYEFEFPTDRATWQLMTEWVIDERLWLSVPRYRRALQERKRTAVVTSYGPAQS